MRLMARTRRLERLLPKPRPRIDDWRKSTPLLTEHDLQELVALGCERHVAPGELGTLTFGQWLSRASVPELLLLDAAARREIAAEDAARRSGGSS